MSVETAEITFDPRGNYLLEISQFPTVSMAGNETSKDIDCIKSQPEFADPELGFIDITNESDYLEFFLNSLVADEKDCFRGLIVFVVASRDCISLLGKIRHRRGDIFAKAEAIRQELGNAPVDEFLSKRQIENSIPLQTALGAALLACRSGGAALFLLDSSPTVDQLQWCRDLDMWNALNELEFVATLPNHFRTGEPQGADHDDWEEKPYLEDILSTLTLRRRLNFGHSQRGFKSFDGQESRKFNPLPRAEFGHLSFDPFREAEHWVKTEFTRLHHQEAFYEHLIIPLRKEIPELSHAKAIGIVLGAIRVCAALAYESLETSPFSCQVFLPFDESKFEDFYELVLNPHPECNFLNFDSYDLLKDYCELAQVDELFVVALPATGRIKGIYRAKNSPPSSESRQTVLARKTRDYGILIHFGHQGSVEVYSPVAKDITQGICLYTKGADWIDPPGAELSLRLREYFPKEDEATQLRRSNLFTAIVQLLEERESSIVVFLAKSRVGTADDPDVLSSREESVLERQKRLQNSQNQIAEMRTPIPAASYPDLADMSPRVLAGLLRVDGAHCINPEGKLVAMGLRILDNAGESAKDAGSGAAAARNMDLIPAFEDAKRIKVSSSGKLKFFSSNPKNWSVDQLGGDTDSIA